MIREGLQKELAKLAALAKEKGAHATIVSSDQVVVADWVRFKCRYGCKGYGKHMGCPPYVPSPEETRRMVREYGQRAPAPVDGIPGKRDLKPEDIPEISSLVPDLILWVNGTVHFLEKTAFYDGFYKAFGSGDTPASVRAPALRGRGVRGNR
jgi:predicted metal-binding protein